MKTGYIAGISRGHNSGVCLLYNGEIVFSIEEERLSRQKYDGSPLSAITLIKEYTDKIDYLVISHTQTLRDAPKIEYIGDNIYTGLARKFGLIDKKADLVNHPQVIDFSNIHHKMHAATAFYRSGFDDAVVVIIDGAGSVFPMNIQNETHWVWETETIMNCSYPAKFKTLYKHYGDRSPLCGGMREIDSSMIGEPGSKHIGVISDTPGITKVYEAVTEYCGFQGIEAGKTMGLFPYGNQNDNIPELFRKDSVVPLSNRNLLIPNYPNGAFVNSEMYSYLFDYNNSDLTKLQNRRDLAYACQKETQDQVVSLVRKAVEMSGKKNVVISGGYGLNCVANYHYLNALKEDEINIYVEPISNDGGTAIGAALYQYYLTSDSVEKQEQTIYLGPEYSYTKEYIDGLKNEYIEVRDCTNKDIVKLLRDKNIVSMYQGRSENGPRALGNRSILFDPSFKDGKDFVNNVKRREYFRPFAGTILKERAHEWFDLRGMDESPFMMYAVNCKEGVEEKIPSIIHVDGTCRIQTVTPEQNKHFYELINLFYEESGIPILFNTSFNLGGEPLVETIEDAIWTLMNSEIEYLYLPEYDKLITIKNR